MFYEVFIPSSSNDGFDVTITVEAENWMSALKSGLERTGQASEVIRNVMCDIKEDNTIHVTDASTARVFILREMGDDAPAPPPMPADAAPPQAAGPPATPVPEEDYGSDFATQKMEPIRPLSGMTPVLDAGRKESYASREPTLPRHRPVAPPPGAAPPPEASGKSERASGPQTAPPPANSAPPRSTAPSGVHAPPPGAAPPSAMRQTGPNPMAPPPSAAQPPSVSGSTMRLTPAPSEMTQPVTTSPAPVPAQSEMTQPVTTSPAPVPEQSEITTSPAQPSIIVSNDAVEDYPDVPMEEGLEERSWTSDDGRMRIGSATFEALKRDEPEPKVVFETRHPSGQRPAVQIGRPSESVSANALEEVFLEINQIHEGGMSMEQVINFVMDLSMAKIRAEAGSIMFADVNGRELYFATARGPKAAEIMDFRVPMTKGLVGFCAREGVSLAISDAEKDPRFYKDISEKLGYETQNLCCAPIQFEGRVYGAIELMNKSQPFSNTEVNVLTYIGRQLAKFVNDLIMAREKI